MTPNMRILPLAFFMLLSASYGAMAQTAGPDEAIEANGGITQSLSLTPAQKSAIYNAVMRQKVPIPSRGIAAVVGAPVLPSVPLNDLPGSAVIDNTGTGVLKYATVESDVVVVDPIQMRVIDVIHGGVTP
ncbi:MAG TPA: hypothetical protein VMF32_08085 [Xanthobacteraceae bacterium]|nr:hypothetical protein [Xanthobacteraceae bacterium]